MKELLTQILTKVDKLDDRLDSTMVEIVEIKKDLKYHIKRTDILEEQVKPINKAYTVLKVVIPIIIGVAVTFKTQLLALMGV